jgi:hypothetical protein
VVAYLLAVRQAHFLVLDSCGPRLPKPDFVAQLRRIVGLLVSFAKEAASPQSSSRQFFWISARNRSVGEDVARRKDFGRLDGGEGGILANVISRWCAFTCVEPLPQVTAFEAFILEAFETASDLRISSSESWVIRRKW